MLIEKTAGAEMPPQLKLEAAYYFIAYQTIQSNVDYAIWCCMYVCLHAPTVYVHMFICLCMCN